MNEHRREDGGVEGRPGIVLLVAAVCGLVLGGCGSGAGSSSESTGTTSAEVVTATGVDFAWDKPSGSALHAAGYTFAVRYLSGYNSKDITKSEAQALWAAGVDIVSNWELCGGVTNCGGPATVSGFATGVADAKEAEAEAAAAGAPPGRPIYFSIDFDTQYTTPDPMPGIAQYFDGVASVIGLSRTGAYGGAHTLQYLFDNGKITWGWQTAAWLYGEGWNPRAQLRQIAFNVSVGSYSACCDEDQAYAADFGQWHAAPAGPQCVNDPGTGDNCGDESVISGGDANTLYHCAGYGPATVIEVCPYGCIHKPPGVPDVCAPAPAKDAGEDAHAAGDAATDARSEVDSGTTPIGAPGDDAGSVAEAGSDSDTGHPSASAAGCAIASARGADDGLPVGAAVAIGVGFVMARRRRRDGAGRDEREPPTA